MIELLNILFYLGISIVVLLIVYVIVFTLPQFGKIPDYKTNDKILKSRQFNGKAFFSPDFSQGIKLDFKKIAKILKSFARAKSIKRPPKDFVLCSDTQLWKGSKSEDGVFITWFGHSSFMLDINGKRLLFDPVFGKYASPFKGYVKRFENSIHINGDDFEKFGKIDAIIISHDHFDHLDYYTIKKLKNHVSRFVVSLGVAAHLVRWGISVDKIHELDWWEEITFENLKLVCTPSQHFSGRNPFKQNSSLWCSWTILGEAGSIFFSGDSGYFKGFEKIGEKYGPFSLAMLECGQYNELWREIHMMPEDTAKAGKDLKAELILPIHNSAFSLSVHSWDEPLKRIYRESEILKVNILSLLQGEMHRL